MSADDRDLITKDNNFIISPIFCSIPAQWLLTFEHISSRLSLIEWEIERKDHRTAQSLDEALQRLHPWRRNVVNYGHSIRQSLDIIEERFGEASRETQMHWKPLIANFRDVEKRYKTLEEKVDRIMAVLSSVLTLEEAKKQIDNARDVARITYLAFVFVPFSLVSSYFSMNQQFDQGPAKVYWVFFVVAVPLSVLCLLIATFESVLKSSLTPSKKQLDEDEDAAIVGRDAK